MGKAVEQQHRGGVANFAGGVFEHHFAIWRVIVALERLSRGEPSRLALQLKGTRVDDWVEQFAGRHHFQLKRKKRPLWSEVRADFFHALKNGAKSVTLVVHTAKAHAAMNKSKPKPRVHVLRFPYSTAPRTIVRHPLVRPSLQAACVIPNATDADLEHLWSVIDFAWQNARKVGRFVAAKAVLDGIPDQNMPPLRHQWVATKAWRTARTVLNRITDFLFHVDDGHFFFDDGAGERGRLSCRTQAFNEFVAAVLKQNPKTLDEVRELL